MENSGRERSGHGTSGRRNRKDGYRALFEAHPHPQWVYDVETLRFLAVNDAAIEKYGYSREAFLAMTIRDIRPTEDVPRLLDNVARVGQGLDRAGLWRHRLADGRVIDVEITSHTVTFEGRRAELVLALDVSERLRNESVLHESEARFRRAIEAAPIPILIHAEDGEVVALSRTWSTITGYGPEELPTVEAWVERAYGSGSSTVRRDIDRTYGLERPTVEGEYVIRCKDGTERTWEFSSIGLGRLPDGRRIAISMAHDVTERNRAQRERENLERQLLQAQKLESVGRLAGGVAHDFNNMLSVILGHAEMLRASLEDHHPLTGPLEEIRNAAQRSAALTQQLLAFARRQPATPEVVDLDRKADGTLTMLRRLIGEHVDLQWRPAREPVTVRVDPGQIDQVLANLCVNARDAIGERGTIAIETARRRVSERAGDYVVLTVRDDGTGMDAATLAHIFEPFFTTKGQGRGTGLGLSTVYGIAQQNGGFVEVDSEPGRGTTFEVFLPFHDAEEVPADERPAVAAARGRETILLVEDEPAILRLVGSMLRGLGYTVLDVADPREAIAIARDHDGPIDLLITDVVLPGMNGSDLADRILDTHPGVRRLFMSGYTADVIARHGVLEPGVHFLQKPFILRELSHRVREILGQPERDA